MSITFTAAQLSAIDTARRNPNSAYPYADAYDLVVSYITDVNGNPKPGVDSGVWLWFNGAAKINRGEGIFSTFIRAYTETQYQLRKGAALSPSLTQTASNSIAEAVLNRIIGSGSLISLGIIADEDANNGMEAIFGDTSYVAAWSGNFIVHSAQPRRSIPG